MEETEYLCNERIDEKVVGPDFSDLPDVTWVTILQYLPLTDRFSVSATCHRLNAAFNHPTLWSSYSIQFWGENHNYSRRPLKTTLNFSQARIVKRFGKYFQHLTVDVKGHLRDMAEETIAVITEVGKECRLETLILHAGALTSEFHTHGYPPKHSVVMALVSFVKTAFRMKHLHIRSWPMFETMDTPDSNVFLAIAQNERLKESLETLTMFGLDESQWSEREPLLFDAATTRDILGAFKNLTVVGLRSPMISEDLLSLFMEPERARLQTLQIFLHYLKSSRRNFSVPNVRSRIWQALTSRNPNFRVECTVLFSVPELEIANMLSPEVPLSVFKVLKYAKLDPQTLVKIYTHYNKTLKVFHSFCDSYCLDEDVLKLVTRCKQLDEFVYHGQVNWTTVVTAAKVNGENWKRFEVKKESIKVEDEYEHIDEDEVVSRREDGELFIVGLMRFHQPEEAREEKIEQMVTAVSSALGFSWRPV